MRVDQGESAIQRVRVLVQGKASIAHMHTRTGRHAQCAPEPSLRHQQIREHGHSWGAVSTASCLGTAGYTSNFGLRHKHIQQRLIVRLTRAATGHNKLPIALDEADHSGCSCA